MALTAPAVVRDLLAQHGIRLKQSLGQHFLVDENVLKKIVSSARLGPDDVIIEIGAGIGTLTQKLAERAGRVIAVEIDGRLLKLLKENLADCANVQIVHQDFLACAIENFAGDSRVKIVGNLPYYVTAPILEKLITAHKAIKSALLMMQREVAQKLCARPGTREASSITIFVQAFADAQQLTKISKNVFFPKPDVDSALVRLEFLDKPRFGAPEKLFFQVVRAAFNLRRKTLKQALQQSPLLALSRDLALQALAEAGIDPDRRGETLTIEEFDRIALNLVKPP